MKNQFRILSLAVAFALAARSASADAPALPLRNVVLFSSGVGYFQRAGRVDGSASIPLFFRTNQVNDILKSLVLFDPTGNVQPVTYATRDSLSQRLQAMGLTVNNSETLGSLLRHFQGSRVRLEMGAETVEGRIISVSVRNMPVPGKEGAVTQVEFVNVLTEAGLRAVNLDSVTQVRLLDERLDSQFRESLALLGGALDDQKREVDLHFGGNKAREVRAGYLQEMPVWKTSYRLVLDPKDKPYLQGWAIVENTTDEDWKDVRLSLVSGRPISFVENLYQPLYISRPEVAPQVIGSPIPQTYGEVLSETTTGIGGQAGEKRKTARIMAPASFGGGGSGAGRGVGNGAMAVMADEAVSERKDMAMSAEQLSGSIAMQTAATERGDLFEYAIGQPVTLPKQQAAMVPIVGANIDGEKVSIYDPDSDMTHALNGFLLKNNSGLHLSGGPITVYQDGVYAGDAQINNVQPDETRLLSYAVDLDLVTGRQGPNYDQQTVSISARNGVLVVTRKQHNNRLYTFRNKTDKAKTVIVQQTIDPAFNLVEPKEAYEKTATAYRFKVEVPAKKSVEFRVVIERPISETVTLIDMDLNLLVSYTTNAQVSAKLKAALGQVVTLRRKVLDLQAQQGNAEGELAAISQEQDRIRQNMDRLEHANPLYQQYVKKLTDQEARIEKLREEVARLKTAVIDAQKELRAYVDTLSVD